MIRPARDVKAINRLNFFISTESSTIFFSESSQFSKSELRDRVSRDANTTLGNAALAALPRTYQMKRYFA